MGKEVLFEGVFPVKVALIGYGNYSKWMAIPCMHHAGIELVSVVEPDGTKQNEAARLLRVPCYSTFDDFLRSGSEFNAIIACATPSVHTEMAVWAMHHRIPILVEKPPAKTAEICKGLCQTLGAENVCVGLMKRFSTAYRMTKNSFKQTPVVLYYRFNAGPIPGKEGHFVDDFSIHALDLVQWLLGHDIECLFSAVSETPEGLSIAGRCGDTAVFIQTVNFGGWGAPGEYLEVTMPDGLIVVDNVVGFRYDRHGVVGAVQRQKGLTPDDSQHWTPNWLLHAASTSSLAHQGYLGEYVQFKKFVETGNRGALASLEDAYKAMTLVGKEGATNA
jgi:predicted dehydrogenase